MANVSHDLRTPINAIQYFQEKAKDTNSITLKNELIYYSLLCCKMLSGIVSDILDFAQIKEGKFKIQFDYFSLSKFFDDILKINSFLASKKQIQLFIENKVQLLNDKIYSDERRLTQVLNNLISNAIKFTETGTISIKAKERQIQDKQVIEISVKDNGVGIKEEIIPLLGQPYQTFDRNGLNSQGIGIGLYLSKKIIQQLGPQENFIIKSKINQGTKFIFSIYLSNQSKQSEIDEIPEELILSNEINDQLISRKKCNSVNIKKKRTNQTESFNHIDLYYRILVVDDDVFNQIIFQMELKQAEIDLNLQIEVILCNNGEEGLNEFKKRNQIGNLNHNNYQINLIFMDLQMPIMDGITATKLIKQEILIENCVDAEIILCSAGQHTEEEKMIFENIGIRYIMQKPFNVMQLKKYIKRSLITSPLNNQI